MNFTIRTTDGQPLADRPTLEAAQTYAIYAVSSQGPLEIVDSDDQVVTTATFTPERTG